MDQPIFYSWEDLTKNLIISALIFLVKINHLESEIKDNKEKRSNSRSNSRLSSSNSKYKKQTNRKNDYKVPESKEYYSKRKQKVYEKKTYYKRESRSSSISKTSSSHSKNIKEECKGCSLSLNLQKSISHFLYLRLKIKWYKSRLNFIPKSK